VGDGGLEVFRLVVGGRTGYGDVPAALDDGPGELDASPEAVPEDGIVLETLVQENGECVVVGVTGMDDDRQGQFAGQGQLADEGFFLDVMIHPLPVVIQADFPDPLEARVVSEMHAHAGQGVVVQLVCAVGVNAEQE